METLNLGYIDLYLIHAPWPWDEWGKDCTEGNIASWQAMEEIYEANEAKSIGVSNFAKQHLEPVLEIAKIVPMVNQICFHIGNRQEETIEFCNKYNMQIMSYSPLATGNIVNDKYIEVIARKYGVTIPQVCIRYSLQKGNVVIPKSTKKERIIENSKVDFELTKEDMEYLNKK